MQNQIYKNKCAKPAIRRQTWKPNVQNQVLKTNMCRRQLRHSKGINSNSSTRGSLYMTWNNPAHQSQVWFVCIVSVLIVRHEYSATRKAITTHLRFSPIQYGQKRCRQSFLCRQNLVSRLLSNHVGGSFRLFKECYSSLLMCPSDPGWLSSMTTPGVHGHLA